jgi:hypothetical protein
LKAQLNISAFEQKQRDMISKLSAFEEIINGQNLKLDSLTPTVQNLERWMTKISGPEK